MKLRTLLIAGSVALAAQTAHADECVDDVMRRVRPALLEAVRDEHKEPAVDEQFKLVLVTARDFLATFPARCSDLTAELQGKMPAFHLALFVDTMVRLQKEKARRLPKR